MAHFSLLVTAFCAAASASTGSGAMTNSSSASTKEVATKLPTSAARTQLLKISSETRRPSRHELPAVADMMRESRKSLKHIANDSSNLLEHVKNQQGRVRRLLDGHKVEYEGVLRDRSAANKREWEKNKEMRTTLKNSYSRAAHIQQQDQAYNYSNMIMRAALEQLLSRANVANEFLDRTETDVAGLNSSEREAVKPTTPKPTMEYYLNKERTRVGLATSFLQMSSETGSPEERTAPSLPDKEQLTTGMLATLSHIAEADQKAETRLWKKFQEKLNVMSQRHVRLVANTEQLNRTLISSHETEVRLFSAKKHLNTTNAALRSRLQGLRVFHGQVASAMQRTLDEADALVRHVYA